MLKFLTFILAVFLLASVWTAFRQRLKLAYKAVAVVYLLGALVRLALMGTDQERLESLAIAAAMFLILWAIAWGATTLLASRRTDKTDAQARHRR
ncbi:MAG: hypothetical protein M0T85_09705 [Dehalococcoidales bacterium]|nr:hypothetical protein [Dehalococcoidales bacterium]